MLYYKNNEKRFWFKMAMQKDSELTSSREHTKKSTAMCRTILSEKKKKAENNLRNSYALSKLKNKIKGKERKPHSKTGRNAKTQY